MGQLNNIVRLSGRKLDFVGRRCHGFHAELHPSELHQGTHRPLKLPHSPTLFTD